MTTPHRPPRSLMDDEQFLAELEHIERGTNAPTVSPAHSAHLDRLDDRLADATFHTQPIDQRAARPQAEVLEDAAPLHEPTWRPLMLAIGFLLLVVAGAACAAFIFRDRVAELFGR